MKSKEEILEGNIKNVSGFHNLTEWHKKFLLKAMEEYASQQVEKLKQENAELQSRLYETANYARNAKNGCP